MHISIFVDSPPSEQHSTASVLPLLWARNLVARGHKVSFVLLLEPALANDERVVDLRNSGWECRVVPFDMKSSAAGGWRHLASLLRIRLWPRARDLFPSILAAPLLAEAMRDLRPDAIVALPGNQQSLGAFASIKDIPKLVVLGDMVHLPALYRLLPPLAPWYRVLQPKSLSNLVHLWHLRGQLIRTLSTFESVNTGAAHYAEWLRRHGIAARHLHSIAPDLGGPRWREQRDARDENSRLRILSIGHLTGTATRAGYWCLADEILPELDKLIPGQYEIHICGKGQLPPSLQAKLDHPSVHFRGFVDDLAAEVRQADAVLVPTPIRLGVRSRTSFMWSLGAAVVEHSANAAGFPELDDGKNCLLGTDGRRVARALVRLRHNPELRRSLGDAGRKTFEEVFAAGPATAEAFSRVESIIADRHRRQRAAS